MSLDLTPFGFTPTETAAYRTLTTQGALSGYALAKALSIARANAYQALHGLVAKGAALPLGGRPERFRPVQPAALFAAITQRSARQLDTLETQLARQPLGAAATVALAGRRALLDTALRSAARSPGIVTCVAPADELVAMAPAWHRRAAAAWRTELWCLSNAAGPTGLPFAARSLDPSLANQYFAAPVFGLITPDHAILARMEAGGPAGFWTSDPVLAGAARATIEHITGGTSDER